MSTLKEFLKDKNKEKLIDDLKLIQKGLDSSGSKEDKKESSEKEVKKSPKKNRFFSFTKKK